MNSLLKLSIAASWISFAMVLIRAEQKPRDVRGARNFNRFVEFSSLLYLSVFSFRAFREYTRISISLERISDVRPSAFTYLPLQDLLFPINSVLSALVVITQFLVSTSFSCFFNVSSIEGLVKTCSRFG